MATTTEKLIGDLLIRHNCVIIPAFGGFVARQTSAVIDYTTGTMSPPRKSLLFNRQLINNDGLLISELAKAETISYAEATEKINELTENWNARLQAGERITIDRVGFLFFDQENNICFEQDRFFNLLLSSYGLGKVHFLSESDVKQVQKIAEKTEIVPPVTITPVFQLEETDIQSEKEEKQPVILEHPALKAKTHVWRYIAASLLLPVAFYSFWIPVKTNVLESGMISFSDFNPFHQHQEGIYHPEKLRKLTVKEKKQSLRELKKQVNSDVDAISYEVDEDTYVPVNLNPEKTVSTSENSTAITVKNESIAAKPGKLVLIIGCFSNRSNANNLVKQLRDQQVDAQIFDEKNGLTRVSGGSSNSVEKMNELQQKLSAAGIDGWILKQ